MPNIGPSYGLASLAGSGVDLTLSGGAFESGVGSATLNASGVDLVINSLIGTSRGTAALGAVMTDEGLVLGLLLPVKSEALLVASGYAVLRCTDNWLSVTDVTLKVYALWGFQVTRVTAMNGYGLDAIVSWLNAAMQLIFSRAEQLDYFNREALTVTVTTSGEVALATNIQRLQGPVRHATTKKDLRALRSISEFERFEQRFLGDDAAVPSGPLAYFLDSSRATAADSVALVLKVTPAPDEDTDFTLDVTREAPRYTRQQMISGAMIEVPHKYAETILLPILMKWAAGDPIMPAGRRQAMMPQLDEQFATANRMLGLAEPATPPVAESKKPKGAAPAP